MATALTKTLLSEQAAISGRRFLVTSREASAANVFHTVPSDSNIIDECWIYAHNYGNTDVEVTFMWGLTSLPSTSAANVSEGMAITIPFQSGRALVFDGTLMLHSLSAAAYADIVNVVTIDGFVNRLTTS